MKRRRGRGEEKKKGGEKGEERKEGGKSPFFFFTGDLCTFYVHSTIPKISTPSAGRNSGFFLASLEKTDLGGSDFFFPGSYLRSAAQGHAWLILLSATYKTNLASCPTSPKFIGLLPFLFIGFDCASLDLGLALAIPCLEASTDMNCSGK